MLLYSSSDPAFCCYDVHVLIISNKKMDEGEGDAPNFETKIKVLIYFLFVTKIILRHVVFAKDYSILYITILIFFDYLCRAVGSKM